jgi:hypothetical protein
VIDERREILGSPGPDLNGHRNPPIMSLGPAAAFNLD